MIATATILFDDSKNDLRALPKTVRLQLLSVLSPSQSHNQAPIVWVFSTPSKGSIAVNNTEPARGGGSGDTIEEIRMNSMASFSAQSRTVTKNDYIVRTLSMPAKFGRVAKAYITQDDQITPYTGEPTRIPNPLALNLYTLGYNQNKQLTNLNVATKSNLSTYLEQYRMLTDAINIKNAYVINFGIDFEITTFKNYNNQDVL